MPEQLKIIEYIAPENFDEEELIINTQDKKT